MIPLILSGGSGSRLWPLSRKQYPKQFLALAGENTLFQQTVERLALEGLELPMVVCNEAHRFIVTDQLAGICKKAQSILLEPFGRSTAPAVAIAALKLLEAERDELLLVLPADHVIDDVQTFHEALGRARAAADRGALVLFGVPATRPETGYGYIHTSDHDASLPDGVLPVDDFIEKPDLATARHFMEQGSYYWNSGIFLFRASRYLEELQRHEPSIYKTCQVALARSEQDLEFIRIDPVSFEQCPENSIDYAVMERTDSACVVPLDAGWNDVGSWSSLWDVQPKDATGNVARGNVVLQNTRNSLVHSENKLVALVGLEDVVVVETKDAVMVAHKDHVQEIRQLVGRLVDESRPEADNHSRVHRPWGSYDRIDEGAGFQVKHITVKPGASLSLQRHRHRAEHWIVVSGIALVTCDDKQLLLSENQSTYIPVASVHRLTNPGELPLELIEVQSGSYLGEDDIERLDDVYGRIPSLMD